MTRHGRVPATAALVAGVALAVGGCASTSSLQDCEEAFESAALSVAGVSAAEFTCTESFGNPQQEGRVTLAAETSDQALTILDEVLRAYASSADLENSTVAYVNYVTEDAAIDVHPADLGFNGNPSLRDIREHYGIEP
ncbi:hypothetical protein GCM10027059_38870 [Myceligenerans halotolerans]